MHTIENINTEDLTFLLENIEVLKSLIATAQESNFKLHPEIYSKNSTYSIKSIKVNDQVYQQFTQTWEENFSYLKLQDLISQSLIEFVERHSQVHSAS